ncbi:MAG: FtsB family cell division protein [Acidimicrobiales bacterium]
MAKGVLAAVALAGLLFLFVFPVRTLLAQHDQSTLAQHRLTELRQENAKLADRAAQLQTTAEIERLARQDYGLVKPGETAYAILPAPPSSP